MPKTTRKHIPLHRLEDHHSEGLLIQRIHNVDEVLIQDKLPMEPHRDDHYIFGLQETGSSRVVLDFRQVTVRAGEMFCILPGQVHWITDARDATGWFLAFHPSMVPEPLRAFFEDAPGTQDPLKPNVEAMAGIDACLRLLWQQYQLPQDNVFRSHTLYSLLGSFLGMAASLYAARSEHNQPTGRSTIITRAFRQQLSRHLKTMKSPAEYACALNLSLSYLNEAVKKTSGLSVSQYIQNEIILEAKRLLYHSDLSIKEIAYELGYEDHTYFSRLFKKVARSTPGDFREQYRE